MPEKTLTQVDDGGQAFPGVETPAGGIPGMSLRDYFAGQAIGNLLDDALSDGDDWSVDAIAADAYRLADAMLTERSKAKAH